MTILLNRFTYLINTYFFIFVEILADAEFCFEFHTLEIYCLVFQVETCREYYNSFIYAYLPQSLGISSL